VYPDTKELKKWVVNYTLDIIGNKSFRIMSSADNILKDNEVLYVSVERTI
jgi:hypothetical protein